MNLPEIYLGKKICINGTFINNPDQYYSSNYFLGYFWVTDVFCTGGDVGVWAKHDIQQNEIENRILGTINDEVSRKYVSNLFFGNKLSSDEKENYVNLGVMHLFVVSGFHLQIILMLRRRFLNIENSKIAKLFDLSMILLFGFLNNWAIPISRGVISFVVSKKNSYLNILITAIIMLLAFPLYIFNLSFILTFSLTFLIIISNDILREHSKYIFPISAVILSNLILYFYLDDYTININGLIGGILITPVVTILTILSFIYVVLSELTLTPILELIDQLFYFLDSLLDLISQIILEININSIEMSIESLILCATVLIIVYIGQFYKRVI
jgi:competence protein ComEC